MPQTCFLWYVLLLCGCGSDEWTAEGEFTSKTEEEMDAYGPVEHP